MAEFVFSLLSLLPAALLAAITWRLGRMGTGAALSDRSLVYAVALGIAAAISGAFTAWALYRTIVDARKPTPAGVLCLLAGETDVAVRACVANHPNTPLDVMEQLARDDQVDVRQGVVWNPSATLAMLRLLAADPDPTTRQRAGVRLADMLAQDAS